MSEKVSGRSDGDSPLGTDSWGGETDWGLIRQASGSAPEVDREKAWLTLIHRYQAPVRRILKRHLRGDPSVEDATNDFFSDLFQKQQILHRADPEQGRFRCYIQGVARRYALQWKRGHSVSFAKDVESLDVAAADENEVEHDEEVAWALAILTHGLARLHRDAPRDADLIQRFYGLSGHERMSGDEIARSRNIAPGTLHVALHRARLKLKAALLEELRPMVSTREDLDQEVQFMITRLCAAHPELDLNE
ncbi:MAG: sigma-70 family RNA polymerase sigma factor [Planctomycetes bacterium]|nr:sigma-70 family RNA polymerase sigma factor [Planctomycetota bacterium]